MPGIELEFGVLLGLVILGQSIFDRFEVETATWKKIFKWRIVAGLTLALFAWVGHWSLLFPFAAVSLGATVHFMWCRKNGIHPIRATPRRKYYELRGWEWIE